MDSYKNQMKRAAYHLIKRKNFTSKIKVDSAVGFFLHELYENKLCDSEEFRWFMGKKKHYDEIKNRPVKKKRKIKARAGRNKKHSNVNFYRSEAWRRLRYKALKKCGGRCQCCGASRKDGVQLHVDHIKPRSNFPNLAMSLSNLQVLCEDCNLGKSNIDETDWR